ncbi:MAG: A/G-specific adenine glycosylase [Pseudomonadota bacterium]
MDEKLRFADLSDLLLDWYEAAARELPWRVGPKARARGVRADPYRVWLAEIMLQQTTVPHATRYYLAFTQRWQTVQDLAAAKDEDVMAAWAGLGYYARARNLLKCARAVRALGAWPDTVEGLIKLPGIGPYTAGAIAALAFDRRAAAVDGNVDRVFARLLAMKGDWKTEKERLKSVVEGLVPSDRPAEFAEGLMDLGATVCTPKSPNCLLCPLQCLCTACAEGTPERYPIKPKKAPKPKRHGHVFVALGSNRDVLTERRPERGLLGGMLGLPTSEWSGMLAPAKFPIKADWQEVGEVRHVFTHFALTLKVWRARGISSSSMTPRADAVDGLPSVFAKALALAANDA